MRGANKASRRFGFTLVELLVVLGILSLLLALLSPAVQMARESARRVACQSHLRQLALSVVGYEATHGCFPAGRRLVTDRRYAGPDPPCTGRFVDRSPWVVCLPFLDQQSEYDLINLEVSIFAAENLTAHTSRIEILTCPSDPNRRQLNEVLTKSVFNDDDPPGYVRKMGRTNYGGCFGSLDVVAHASIQPNCILLPQVIAQANGILTDITPIRSADVTDGLSATMLIAEKAGASLVNDPDRSWWISGTQAHALFTATAPINLPQRTGFQNFPAASIGASSYHPGGVYVAMGDGSVRWVDDSISSWNVTPFNITPEGASQHLFGYWTNLPPAGIWQAMATRDGS